MDLHSIRAVIEAHAFRTSGEDELQVALDGVLRGAGLDVEREVRIDERDRIDFVVGGSVAVEVKVDGSLAAVTRQLHRYAEHPGIEALMLVTTRSRHLGLPAELGGKRLEVVPLLEARAF